MNRRRVTVRVLQFLFAGVIASVGISWLCEVFHAYLEDAASAIGSRGGHYEQFAPSTIVNGRLQLVRIRIRWPGCEEWSQCYDDWLAVYPIDWPGFDRPPPNWVPSPDTQSHQAVGAIAAGLPWLCMKSNTVQTTPQTPLRWIGKHNGYSVYLPLIPIWSGLLLNTLFYASLFSAPILLRQTRHYLRLRRGHCPTCNYNLLNDFTKPCPECGALRDSGPRTQD